MLWPGSTVHQSAWFLERFFGVLGQCDQEVGQDPSTVALIESASRKSICIQTLKVDANDRSAQELQNGLYNEVHTKFLTKLWAFENVDIPI
jgi:hypothetical protein